MSTVVVSGSFDDFRSRDFRFLYQAATLGSVHALLWSDDVVREVAGRDPKFPLAERLYVMEATRYVDKVTVVESLSSADMLPDFADKPDIWALQPAEDNVAREAFCTQVGIRAVTFTDEDLAGFPELPSGDTDSDRKKVVVTGCYDWFHSGHVRFFEEVSEHGDLYVVAGNDANVLLLKGDGHPMFPQDERRFIVQSIRFVKQALISTGSGWMDAEPEVKRIGADAYAVNEDGDRPEKQAFCKAHDLEYIVLKRTPKEGLPRRESTHLRGF